MNMRPNALVFDYDEFPPVPEDEWEGSELRHAAALAVVLSDHLRSHGVFAPEVPIQEDFGAVLPVSGREGVTDIFISFYPREFSDFTWALQFRERKPLLRALFSKGDDDHVVGPVKECIASLVVNESSRYKNCEWIEASEL